MCIICIKEPGIPMPSTKEITNCHNSNPHGSGYMYAHNDLVYIRKGFFTVADLKQSIASTESELQCSLDKLPVILHFRLATSGKISSANCHPFPNSRKQKWLKRTHIYWRTGVAHNGIAPYKCTQDELSDSQMFILKKLWKYEFEEMIKLRKEIFPPGFNKFAILNGDGNILTIGDFHIDASGRRWSNFGYQWERGTLDSMYKHSLVFGNKHHNYYI